MSCYWKLTSCHHHLVIICLTLYLEALGLFADAAGKKSKVLLRWQAKSATLFLLPPVAISIPVLSSEKLCEDTRKVDITRRPFSGIELTAKRLRTHQVSVGGGSRRSSNSASALTRDQLGKQCNIIGAKTSGKNGTRCYWPQLRLVSNWRQINLMLCKQFQ